MRGKSLDFSEVYDVRALRVIVPEVEGLLHGARRGAQPVAADPEGVRRLHLAPQGQPVPVAAHRGDRARAAARWKCRSAPRRCTARPNTASPRTGSTRKRPKPRSSSSRRWRGCGSCSPGATEVADCKKPEARRYHLRAHAAGQGDRPAGRLDADRLRLRAAHRPRPSLPRRKGRRPHRQARHAARQRPARRDRRGKDRRSLARLAESGARLRP